MNNTRGVNGIDCCVWWHLCLCSRCYSRRSSCWSSSIVPHINMKLNFINEHSILCMIEVCLSSFHKASLESCIQVVYRIFFKNRFLFCFNSHQHVVLQIVVKSQLWNRKVVKLLSQVFYDVFSKERRILINQTFYTHTSCLIAIDPFFFLGAIPNLWFFYMAPLPDFS